MRKCENPWDKLRPFLTNTLITVNSRRPSVRPTGAPNAPMHPKNKGCAMKNSSREFGSGRSELRGELKRNEMEDRPLKANNEMKPQKTSSASNLWNPTPQSKTFALEMHTTANWAVMMHWINNPSRELDLKQSIWESDAVKCPFSAFGSADLEVLFKLKEINFWMKS